VAVVVLTGHILQEMLLVLVEQVLSLSVIQYKYSKTIKWH